MKSALRAKLGIFLVLIVILSLTGCEMLKKNDPGTSVSGTQILAFEDAMEQLVNGLNKLSDKDKNFGMLLDEVNVSFSLSKKSDKTFGVDFNAKAESTASTSFESFYVEKKGISGTSKNTAGTTLLNSILGTGVDEKTEKKEESSSSGENSTTNTDNSENSNKLAGTAGTTAGAGVSANYSSTVVGSGENVIAIKFKSLGSYPNEKLQALSSVGMLGCLPFYVQVLGANILDKEKVALLDEIISTSENINCDSSAVPSIAETGRDVKKKPIQIK